MMPDGGVASSEAEYLRALLLKEILDERSSGADAVVACGCRRLCPFRRDKIRRGRLTLDSAIEPCFAGQKIRRTRGVL